MLATSFAGETGVAGREMYSRRGAAGLATCRSLECAHAALHDDVVGDAGRRDRCGVTPERIILVAVVVLGLGWGAWRFVLWLKRRGRVG